MQTLTRFLPIVTDDAPARETLVEKYAHLQEIVREMHSVVIGFSGGADSALLAKSPTICSATAPSR